MIQQKCPLCSRLFSRLKKFFCRLSGIKIDCKGINQSTSNAKELRVAKINLAAPDCACEKCRMSEHSPGVVEDSETLVRFIFLPIQIDKNGNLTPAAFSHVHTNGCSIQRESIVENKHALALVQQTLSSKDKYVWKGVLVGKCHDIRLISLDEANRRAVCVYDTAEPDNPAHGELCQTQHIIEADQNELRHDLLVAFGNGALISPLQYRNGAIWDNLPQPLQSRK